MAEAKAYLIGDFTGLEDYKEAWLSMAESFRELSNLHIYRGRALVRRNTAPLAGLYPIGS